MAQSGTPHGSMTNNPVLCLRTPKADLVRRLALGVGGNLWRWSGVRLHNGPPRTAIRGKTTNRSEESRALTVWEMRMQK